MRQKKLTSILGSFGCYHFQGECLIKSYLYFFLHFCSSSSSIWNMLFLGKCLPTTHNQQFHHNEQPNETMNSDIYCKLDCLYIAIYYHLVCRIYRICCNSFSLLLFLLFRSTVSILLSSVWRGKKCALLVHVILRLMSSTCFATSRNNLFAVNFVVSFNIFVC